MKRTALFDYMGLKKVELLAPAGNYESFLGAIKAGADAVYLGGNQFSARAYADNFSAEELLKAISYAHIFNRKVYMTINTLCKDQEMEALIAYLEQFYLAGLDGVIIQDIGVLLRVKEVYPGLELHVSTQMSITGMYGAQLLKDMGAVRIVPARELSLEEIKSMKEATGLEIETFIHGAMCYCYSGQCLFSSILGGRSGNRGRCAQPCRLPYTMNDEKGRSESINYPLSLKDMCSISLIPKLIEAGIDSFKIEGRMKKAEYAAGVTAIYRKYIDLYYECDRDNYHVEKSDLDVLLRLYIRSDIQDGYYKKHNGADMITLHSPAYSGSDERLLSEIRKSYIENPLKKKISMDAVFCKDHPVKLIISCEGQEQNTISVKIEADAPLLAEKQPITVENIKKGLLKLGNTNFYCDDDDIKITLQDGLFYSLKMINELRRKGMEALEKKLCERECRKVNQDHESLKRKIAVQKADSANMALFSVLVSTMEQLSAVSKYASYMDVIYIESCLYPIPNHILTDLKQYAKVYIALPYVVRKNDYNKLSNIYPFILASDGCLIRNMETYGWLKHLNHNGNVRTDAGIYCFNKDALSFWTEKSQTICLPYELNGKELRTLIKFTDNDKIEQNIYGRIPLMITANCVAKTSGKCGDINRKQLFFLKDRYHKDFPVFLNCTHCYNIIYNSVPLSLHDKVIKGEIHTKKRINFTTEDGMEAKKIMDYFIKACKGMVGDLPYTEYTLGHDKRGVE